jgi:hypothetical protein
MIAQEILNQLGGGRKLSFMIGLKNAIGKPNGLDLKFPKSPKKINYVKITLNEKDLYDLEFCTLHNSVLKTISVENDIYAEDLKRCFERNTAYYLTF